MRILQGRSALITGATGYLGRSMTLALAEAGAHVIVNGRNAGSCDDFVRDLRDRGLSAEKAVFDVNDETAVKKFVRCWGEGNPLHILVNNASSGRGGSFQTSTDQDFSEAYSINLIAAQRLIKELLPSMRNAYRRDGDAAIVNIASMYGLVSPNLSNYDNALSSNPPFYGAAKAALIQLTRYIACELGPEGIRCNALAPGPFPKPEVQKDLSSMVARLVNDVPMRRIGQSSEMAGPVLFLASPAASYVTGAVLPVDGGWTAW